MNLQLFQSLCYVINLFSSSITTVWLVCKYCDVPIVNPEFKAEQLDKYYKKIKHTFIHSFFGTVFLFHIVSRNFEKTPHTIHIMWYNVSLYVTLVEAAYYGYHRLVHMKYLYKTVHSTHHENRVVYPMDSMYVSVIDVMCYVSILHSPALFINMNYTEFLFCFYFYLTCGFLSHCKIMYDHHAVHHQKFKYNFCLVFPIYDHVFNTYK